LALPFGPFTIEAMQRRVLVVEDEPSIAETILYALRTELFDAVHHETGNDALAALAKETFDCVILDVGLPDISGFDVCQRLRQHSQVPVIFLTARDGEIDRVLGLEIGGDDYVPKPFSPRELVARVRAILRRAPASPKTETLTTKLAPNDPLHHDERRKVIHCHGKALDLSRNEYTLLLTFMKYPGRVLSREELLDLAWPDPGSVTDRTVDAHIKSLRAKIRDAVPDFDPIETRRGLGYALKE
jgi:two-component system catabolic regulation response regulator CreB